MDSTVRKWAKIYGIYNEKERYAIHYIIGTIDTKK